MIVLADEIAGGEAPVLPLLDVTVERNAFGRQLDSFEARARRADPRRHAGPRASSSAPRSSSASGPTWTSSPASTTAGSWPSAQRNVIATAFHPELAGETRFHRLVATMAAEHDDPGEGSGRRAPSDARAAAARRDGSTDERASAPPRSSGKVRAARLTDLAALGELSRLCQSDGADTRSLGLPVNGPPIGVFSLFRLPLGAFRPNDLHVRLRGGRPDRRPRPRRARDGPRRVDDRGARRGRDGQRRRHPLPARPAAPARGRQARRGALPRRLRRRRRQRRAAHAGRASCATARSGSCPGRRTRRCPTPWSDERAAAVRDPADDRPSTRSPCRGCTPSATPAAGQPARGDPARRLGAPGRRTGGCPRSSLAPILRFADVEAFVQATPGGGRTATELDGFVQVGVAKEDQPHYLKVHRPARGRRRPPLVDFGLGVDRRAGTTKDGDQRRDHGVIAPVRTYESPIDRRLEEAGFESIASVTLLHEGNPRPRRRAGPRAGRRPIGPGGQPWRSTDDRQRRDRSTTSTCSSRRCRRRSSPPSTRCPTGRAPDRGRPGPRPPAGGALPGFAR